MNKDVKRRVFDAAGILLHGLACSSHTPRLSLPSWVDAPLSVLSSLYDYSLVVLFRMLFVLYAEARGILPQHPTYAPVSFSALHRFVFHHQRDYTLGTPTSMPTLWERLCLLWQTLDSGVWDGDMCVVPTGCLPLFSRKIDSSLLQHVISCNNATTQQTDKGMQFVDYAPLRGGPAWRIDDASLARVILLLAYGHEHIDGDEPPIPIGYATHDSRCVGALYESLLNYQPEYDATHEQIVLVSHQSSRKKSGTYYTPSSIVNAIVAHTIEPLVAQAAEEVAALRAVYGGDEFGVRASDLLAPYLSLTILDPAMGSGYFLLRAAEVISQAMADDPNLMTSETDTAYATDEERLAHYRWLVIEHCLYGVDINWLAVEIARGMLWLCAASHYSPSYSLAPSLLHHLRCGNSLAGGPGVIEIGIPARKGRRSKAYKHQHAVESGFIANLVHKAATYWLMPHSGKELDSRKDAKTQRTNKKPHRLSLCSHVPDVRDGEETLQAKIRAAANCWLARAFGAPMSVEAYQQLGDALEANLHTKGDSGIPHDDTAWQALTQTDWFEQAQRVAHEHNFFHWELEFPELFWEHGEQGVKPKARPGFDAVIGNPPYVSFGLRAMGRVSEYYKALYRVVFPHAAEYKVCLYALFMEAGLRLTRPGGYHGYIVPDSFLTGKFFSRIRSLLVQSTHIHTLVLFRDDFWQSGSVGQPVLYVVKKADQLPTPHPLSLDGRGTSKQYLSNKGGAWGVAPGPSFVIGMCGEAAHTNNKKSFAGDSPSHATCFGGADGASECDSPSATMGERNNDNDVALHIVQNLDAFAQGDMQSGSVSQAWFAAAPLQRLCIIPNAKDRMIVQRMEEASVVLGSLVQLYSGLIGKQGKHSIMCRAPDGATSGKLIASSRCLDRFVLRYEGWYCTGDARMYKSGYLPQIYENPKLFFNQTGSSLKCCYDAEGYYCLNNMHVAAARSDMYTLLYINALVCSTLMGWYYRTVSMEHHGRALAQVDIDMLALLPVRRISFTTSLDERKHLVCTAQQLYEQCVACHTVDNIMAFVQERLAHVPEQSDVVHDLLAMLAQELIDTNRHLAQEVKSFVSWLEALLGTTVDRLTHKAKLQAYYRYDADVLLDVVCHNRAKLTIDPDDENIRTCLETRCRADLVRLAPLMQRLAMTERVLDAVVYVLYGVDDVTRNA